MIPKILDQGFRKLQLSGQIQPTICFANTDLLAHRISMHLLIAYGCFHATTAEFNNCEKGYMDHKA